MPNHEHKHANSTNSTHSPADPQTVCTSLCSRLVSPQDPSPDPSVFLSPMAVSLNPSLAPDATQSSPSLSTLPIPALPKTNLPPPSPPIGAPKFQPRSRSTRTPAPRYAIRHTPRVQGLIGRSQTSAASNCSVSSGRTAFSLCICRIAVSACIRSPPFPTPSTTQRKGQEIPQSRFVPRPASASAQCQVPTSTN